MAPARVCSEWNGDILRVLVVDDDRAVAGSLTRSLRWQGYDASAVGTGADALDLHREADLVLLDLELRDLDGWEVCRRIRSASDTPMIALAARGGEPERVRGLRAGFDEYLVKPYGFHELVARIDALMRRVRADSGSRSRIRRGRMVIDTDAREVHVGGRRIGITRKEFDLLRLLASQPESVVPRRRIISEVWGSDFSLASRTIDTHVSSLRSKLGAKEWIVNVRGIGFRIGEGA
ncbi:response regulator transcription factor [Saccharopolyspora indica]|nr:response regulator transcription factor [Saccharopolyspora indica]MDA3645752.1 response regulator transcription factor [Saccharopolyspora indica]